MSEPFVGEIRMFAGNFAPRGWAFCDGQLLAVSQNDALFSLLGTIYGGDGRTTMALPNLQGRAPMLSPACPIRGREGDPTRAASRPEVGWEGGRQHATSMEPNPVHELTTGSGWRRASRESCRHPLTGATRDCINTL